MLVNKIYKVKVLKKHFKIVAEINRSDSFCACIFIEKYILFVLKIVLWIFAIAGFNMTQKLIKKRSSKN